MYFSKNQKEKYYMEIDILFKEYDLETLYKENILAKTAPSILTIFSAILTGLISYCIGKDGGIFWFLELISFVIIFGLCLFITNIRLGSVFQKDISRKNLQRINNMIY